MIGHSGSIPDQAGWMKHLFMIPKKFEKYCIDINSQIHIFFKKTSIKSPTISKILES